MIYISFDVDSMDCDLVSRGTGTPVPNGLSEEEATEIVCGLVADPKTCCLEVTEVNPTLDNKKNTIKELVRICLWHLDLTTPLSRASHLTSLLIKWGKANFSKWVGHGPHGYFKILTPFDSGMDLHSSLMD